MPKNGEKSLTKVFAILETIAHSGHGLNAKELALELELPISTLFRMLKFLTDRRYLAGDRGIYTLGVRMLQLGYRAGEQNALPRCARPCLRELSVQTRETVHLAELRDDQVYYLDKVEGSRSIHMGSQVGNVSPLHCTGIGKAMLAGLPEKRRRQLCAELSYQVFTPTTIRDAATLLAELDDIRERGFALDQGEHEPGVFCLAAPILDREGNLLAGVSLSGSELYLRDRIAELAPLVIACARKIGTRLEGC